MSENFRINNEIYLSKNVLKFIYFQPFDGLYNYSGILTPTHLLGMSFDIDIPIRYEITEKYLIPT
jgi:hypothetical protein